MKKYVIAWFVILFLVILGAIGIYNDVKEVDTNKSKAIEVSTPELQKLATPDFDFSFEIITLDNVKGILKWGVIIVMGIVAYFLYAVYNFFETNSYNRRY